MSKVETLVKYVIDNYPHVKGNNTELCIAVWKEAISREQESQHAYAMGEFKPTAGDMCSAIRKYKPESIVRKRRELLKPTKQQADRGYAVHKHYGHGEGENPLY